MTAAISAFKGDTLILGDMLELGEFSAQEHQNIVNLIKQKDCSNVMLVGGEFAQTDCSFKKYANVDQLIEILKNEPLQGKHILLKGSHGIHLEKLIDLL